MPTIICFQEKLLANIDENNKPEENFGTDDEVNSNYTTTTTTTIVVVVVVFVVIISS